MNKIVLYTDGGCRPNPGIGGYGVHGYSYIEETPKQGSGCKGNYPSKDGYKPNNTKPDPSDEITVVKYFDLIGSLIPNSTNNEAEVVALWRALQIIEEQEAKDALIKADSKYALMGIQEWLPKWKKLQYVKPDGNEVSNAEKWKLVDEVYTRLIANEYHIRFEWVKGHGESVGNNEADISASRGIMVGRNGKLTERFFVSDPKGYWNIDNEIHRFVGLNRWVFINNGIVPKEDNLFIYLTTEMGKGVEDALLNKKSPDARYTIMFLKEQINVFEKVRTIQFSIPSKQPHAVVIGRIDNILKPRNYRDVARADGDFFYIPRSRSEFYDLEDNPLTVEMNPPGLSLRIFDIYDHMYQVLHEYRVNKEYQGFCLTDITDQLYTKEEKGKKTIVKLRKDIDSSTRYLDFVVKHPDCMGVVESKLRLLVGNDILKRNSLAALASESLKVYVVTYRESDYAFRYGTIIETDGEYSFQESPFSNIKIVNI